MPDTSFDSVYNKALNFLSFRPRGEKEVFDYLTKERFGKYGKKGPYASEEIANQIIEKLKDYKFINDLEFAKWFIENRRKASRIVRMELTQKGIDKKIIDASLADFDLDKKENDLIDHLIEKKWKGLGNIPKDKAYVRLVGFLIRKGFDYDEIRKKIQPLFKANQFDD